MPDAFVFTLDSFVANQERATNYDLSASNIERPESRRIDHVPSLVQPSEENLPSFEILLSPPSTSSFFFYLYFFLLFFRFRYFLLHVFTTPGLISGGCLRTAAKDDAQVVNINKQRKKRKRIGGQTQSKYPLHARSALRLELDDARNGKKNPGPKIFF